MKKLQVLVPGTYDLHVPLDVGWNAGTRLVRLTVERTRRARELCAIAVPTQNLEAFGISIFSNPPPQPGTACTEIVFFAMCCAVQSQAGKP